jgi:alpha-tubulin suppressor-like RCC1 family protein
MALGKFHTCLLLRGGKVRCWGANFDAELGLGHRRRIGDDEPASAAPLVELGEPAVALTAAGDREASFTCALLESRNLRCWGSNHFGQLGLGKNVARIGEDELPADVETVPVGGPVELLTSGAMQYATHACAMLDSGDLRCWGNNRYGQLGLGHTRHVGRAQVPANVNPVDVGGDIVQLGAGKFHTCALLEGGDLRCWGRNHTGQLGYAHTDNIGDDELPAEVDVIDVGEPVEEVSVGRAHTCALLEGGRARCWGWNKYGQLGYGHTDDIGDDEAPASAGDIDVGSEIVHISAGGLHTCALLEEGRVRCWGDNRFGQLGYGHRESIGDEEPPSRANDVYLGGRAVAIEASNYHSCALLEDETLRCWGFNDYGQLGYGHTDHIGDNEAPASAGPVPVFDAEQRAQMSETDAQP